MTFSTSRNFLAGLANSVWSALLGLAVVPFYLKYLGIEAYGLIGFFATLQSILQLLDMGIAPAINREVARCSVDGNIAKAGKLMHTLEIIYWCVAGIIGLSFIALAPSITEYWIQSTKLSSKTILYAVMLMGLVAGSRWPIGLYQGALVGAQRLAISSGISIAMITIGNFGALLILIYVSPTIEAFFIWQAFVGLIYATAMRIGAWSVIGKNERLKFDVYALKGIWRFTLGMSGITLMGLVFSQFDKLLLSKFLSLAEYGNYMLASLVVAGLYVVVIPAFNTVYPKFSALAVECDVKKINYFYRYYLRLLSIILFPMAMLLVFFSKELVYVWTSNLDIAITIAPLVSLLAIGSALNGVMYVPHALQLSFGLTKLPLLINGILIVVFLPMIIFLALKFGSVGGAIAWLTLNLFYVLLSAWMTHKYILKKYYFGWTLYDLGLPFFLSIFIGAIAKYISQNYINSISLTLLIAMVGSLFSMICGVLFTPQLRNTVYSFCFGSIPKN